MDYYKRIYKGVKNCPCCGSQAYFGIVSGASFACQCGECGLTGKEVGLPNYWGKGGKRMIGRLYMRALAPWNRRV